MIRLFQRSRLLPEITQDNIHIQTPKLQSKCHSRNITTIALNQFTAQCQSSKFFASPNYSALTSVPTAASLLLGAVYCQSFSLNHWELELPINLLLSYLETTSNSTMVNSLLWQWPASSLLVRETKAVATVYGMAITLCSHWQFAPKWLSPLIVTKLKNVSSLARW